MQSPSYAFTREVSHLTQEAAIAKVKERLGTEGFGVLTEIDVQATLKKKIGVDRTPYVILGACNPPLAHRALEAEPSVGVFLPCNVDVFQLDGKTVVQTINPRVLFDLVKHPTLAPIADDIGARLQRVLEGL